MIALLFIFIYLLFICIGAAALYTSMKKGQSIEEYLNCEKVKGENGLFPVYVMVLIPGVDVIAGLWLLVILIYNLIKNFRK